MRVAKRRLRLALHAWRLAARHWSEQRHYLQTQATECIRMVFARWNAIAEGRRVSQLAHAVAAERSQIAISMRGFDRWRRWLAFERVMSSRQIYRQSETVRPDLALPDLTAPRPSPD